MPPSHFLYSSPVASRERAGLQSNGSLKVEARANQSSSSAKIRRVRSKLSPSSERNLYR
jgi:hypothetical protein